MCPLCICVHINKLMFIVYKFLYCVWTYFGVLQVTIVVVAVPEGLPLAVTLT